MRIARRFNAGSRSSWHQVPKTADSIPQVPLVIFDTVFLQQCQELRLKRHAAMMLRLAVEVLDGFAQLQHADARCCDPVHRCRSTSKPAALSSFTISASSPTSTRT